MNILFLLGVYPNYGGTEKVTTILANEFTRQGHRISIVSFEQPFPELAERELDSSIRLYSLSYPVYSSENRRRLRGIVREEHTDIIINQWCLPYYVTQLINYARKGTKCKLVAVLHGVPDKSKRIIVAADAIAQAKNTLKRLFCKAKYRIIQAVIQRSIRYVYSHSDRYVVLSEGFIKTLQQYTGLRETPKLLSIGNPVTIPVDYETDFIAEKRKQILYVGRMDMENKRVNRIVEAWEDLHVKYTDWELILVGDGPHRKQLQQYAVAHQIKRITFTGFVKEEPIRFYKQATVLMLTSDLEGFGLVIVEGMSYGVVPVVYGSYAAVYDIITDGVDGYITPMPYSREETVSRLRAIMDDPDRARSMAEAARDKSRQFSLPAILAQWEQLFQSLQ